MAYGRTPSEVNLASLHDEYFASLKALSKTSACRLDSSVSDSEDAFEQAQFAARASAALSKLNDHSSSSQPSSSSSAKHMHEENPYFRHAGTESLPASLARSHWASPFSSCSSSTTGSSSGATPALSRSESPTHSGEDTDLLASPGAPRTPPCVERTNEANRASPMVESLGKRRGFKFTLEMPRFDLSTIPSMQAQLQEKSQSQSQCRQPLPERRPSNDLLSVGLKGNFGGISIAKTSPLFENAGEPLELADVPALRLKQKRSQGFAF